MEPSQGHLPWPENASVEPTESSYDLTSQFRFCSSLQGLFVSPKIRAGLFPYGKLIAAEPIPPGSILFNAFPKFLYPTFLLRDLKEFEYKLVDVRSGVVPSSWSCICCSESVGTIVPVWCPNCDLPLCSNCGFEGAHVNLDTMCGFVTKNGVRRRRFLELGNVYLDVALARFLIMQFGSEGFQLELNQLITSDPRFQSIAASAGEGSIGEKLNEKALPFAFSAAIPVARTHTIEVREAVLMAYAFLSTNGTGFYPNPERSFYHPILGTLTQNCNPNVEIRMKGDRSFEILTTRSIDAAEKLGLDFLQHPLLTTVQRQRFHQSRWGEGCPCERCCGPTVKLGLSLDPASVKSAGCDSSLFEPQQMACAGAANKTPVTSAPSWINAQHTLPL